MTGETIAGLWAGGVGICILGSVVATLLIGSYYKPKVRQVIPRPPASPDTELLIAELRHVYAEIRRIETDRAKLQERLGETIDPQPFQEWRPKP